MVCVNIDEAREINDDWLQQKEEEECEQWGEDRVDDEIRDIKESGVNPLNQGQGLGIDWIAYTKMCQLIYGKGD